MNHKFFLIILLLLSGFIVFLFVQSPSHDRQWNGLQQRLASISDNGSTVTIEGIRDFRYDKTGQILSDQTREQTFAYNELINIWFGLSHFGGHGLAHAFLSFEFSDNRFLALSIEARLEDGETYHPIKGLLKQYEKIFVFATEADVIGLRTHARKEKVLLYPLQLDQQRMESLLHYYVREAAKLQNEPQFYNTLLDNCLTGILRSDAYFTKADFLTNTDIIFPGRSDKLAFKLGLLDNSLPLNTLRNRALINSNKSSPASADFSIQIRSGWQETFQ